MFIIIKKKHLWGIFTFLLVFLLLCTSSASLLIKTKNNARHTAKDLAEYIILIEIEDKKLYLYENGNLIKQYPIASGKDGWPSPIGRWKIINKGDWGEGFGGRWMGLNVRWGKYGIHGTTREGSIGRAASHGCIRMFNKHVKELYNIVPVGTVVIIRNGPFGPFGTGFRNLEPGDRGSDVLAVQQRLKALKYFNGYESGIYGDDLKKALKQFQKDYNLKIKHTITKEDYNAMGFSEFE